MKKNVKITSQKKSQEEMFEIVLDHQEGNIKWKKGQVVSVKEKVSGDYWEVQVESRDGSRQTGAIKPWRLSEYQPGSMGENPRIAYQNAPRKARFGPVFCSQFDKCKKYYYETACMERTRIQKVHASYQYSRY